LRTRAPYHDYVDKLRSKPRESVLSKPALETLSIIAYRQPVTRARVEAVRGVNVDHIIATLLERELIAEAGRADTPGRPILYVTTPEFLQLFGLNSLEELPPLEELLPEGEK
jgi:segregation and condensation protein B